MKTIFLALTLLLFVGCGCDTRPEVQPALLSEETIVNCEMVPTSFNENPKFRIQTDKHVFVCWGYPSPVEIGSKVQFYQKGAGYYVKLATSSQLYFAGSN